MTRELEAVRHTPGPWTWGAGFKFGDSTGDLFGLGGRSVLSSASYENMWLSAYDRPVDAANARLIAAAPELLEALREAHIAMWGVTPEGQDFENHQRLRKARDQARAAISKAEGRNT